MLTKYLIPTEEDHKKFKLTAYSFQGDLRNLTLKYCEKFDCFIDIGAHIGYWTVDFAPKFKQVEAFEPYDPNFHCLLYNTNHLENVGCYNIALGCVNGRAICESWNNATSSVRAKEKLSGTIDLKTLDSYNLKPDLIKIDTEGAEYFICRGAEKTILENKPMMVIEQKPHQDLTVSQFAAKKFLEELGMIEIDRLKDDYILGWK